MTASTSSTWRPSPTRLWCRALAARLGVGVRSDDPLPDLIGFLQGRHVLVVLDSCEHVIDAVAGLAERLIAGTGEVHLLATSREALRVEGEHVHRLAPLSVPDETEALDAETALAFPSVQLFVERAAAGHAGFTLGNADAPAVADICRRLDGMALAIEVAAGWVDAFGVGGLAARLTDRFQLLMRGRRTALPRHQTLGATLNWSYTELPELERRVLRRLAIFVGAFTLDSACALLTDADCPATDAVDAVASLVRKSLVSADVDRKTAFYRLFDAHEGVKAASARVLNATW